MFWLVSWSMEHYRMHTFELTGMDLFGNFVFFLLAGATLIAQFGFITLAKDLENYKRDIISYRKQIGLSTNDNGDEL